MRKKWRGLIFSAIVLLMFVGCHKDHSGTGWSVPRPVPSHEVWVLMGQSNMTGETMAEYPYNKNIKILFSKAGRRGIGYPFAMERVRVGHSVTLIQCAVGGTSIDLWTRGGSLYNECLRLIGEHKPTGFLFAQGEQDAMKQTPVNWSDQFMAMVSGLHSLYPGTPIIYTKIGDRPPGYVVTQYDHIRHEQDISFSSNVYEVSTDGIPHADGWHYSREQGYEVAARMLSALGEN